MSGELNENVFISFPLKEELLPNGYFFKIYSAFRPQEEQIRLWNENYQKMKSENPTLSESEITLKTRAVCADPRNGFGGHQSLSRRGGEKVEKETHQWKESISQARLVSIKHRERF